MKRILLLLALAAGYTSQAQLPNGSTAPDFTATDINGNTHTLSEYLAAGKTVILDISAAWCNPCWNFHGSHKLEDLYESYGPGGSDEIVVLFVEGDPNTPLSMITGTGQDPIGRTSQGDWTANTPYPIIDSGAISNLYEIAYFPTLYRICPDGITTLLNTQSTVVNFRNGINTNCGQMDGLQNYPSVTETELYTCAADGAIQGRLRNLGSNAMTTATLSLKENGNVIETKEWTGNTGQFAYANVNFASTALNNESTYTVEVSAVNGVAPAHPEAASRNVLAHTAELAESTTLTINIFTDYYSDEATWEITNGAGTSIASGGPYDDDSETMVTETFEVPANTTDCYTLTLSDSFGDGWNIGITEHGVQILDGSDIIFEKFIGARSFETLSIPGAFRTEAAMGVVDAQQNAFAIYPNPSNGIFNVHAASAGTISVSDVTGKTVYTGSVSEGSVLDLTALQSGMYIAKVKTATAETVEKLIIK